MIFAPDKLTLVPKTWTLPPLAPATSKLPATTAVPAVLPVNKLGKSTLRKTGALPNAWRSLMGNSRLRTLPSLVILMNLLSGVAAMVMLPEGVAIVPVFTTMPPTKVTLCPTLVLRSP